MNSAETEQRIRIEDSRLIIEDFQTDNSDIVSYFEHLDESNDISKKLEGALKVGIIAMRSTDTAENVNYVEKAFDNLGEKMEKQICSAFGEGGQFSGILKDHFGEDGKIIKEIFNPSREGSPLYSLRSELEKQLSDIRERLGINSAREELITKSPEKGLNFEDDCEKKLDWIANIHSDKLERTTNKVGKIPNRRVGDFALTLGDTGKRIVFEMKNQTDKPPLNGILKELKEAMENRYADYGIYVSRTKDALPECVGWFNEYDGNQLVCAVENNDGGSMIDGEMIHLAYKWARAKLGIESAQEMRLDPAFVREKSNEIKKKIEEIKKIRRQCTNIKQSAEEIWTVSGSLEKEINKGLDEIIESLDSYQRSGADDHDLRA